MQLKNREFHYFCNFKALNICCYNWIQIMANTVVQNCQRGIIFLTFSVIVFFFIMTVISLIKKLIDSSQSSADGQSKYQEGQQKPVGGKSTEQSADKFDTAAIEASKIKEDDTTLIKIIKKGNQFKFTYFPLIIVIPLNILTGTSKAFSLVFYLFILLVVLIFNIAKIHKKCCEHKCIIVLLQNLWIFMLFFEFVNVWGATPTYQPYIIIQK